MVIVRVNLLSRPLVNRTRREIGLSWWAVGQDSYVLVFDWDLTQACMLTDRPPLTRLPRYLYLPACIVICKNHAWTVRISQSACTLSVRVRKQKFFRQHHLQSIGLFDLSIDSKWKWRIYRMSRRSLIKFHKHIRIKIRPFALLTVYSAMTVSEGYLFEENFRPQRHGTFVRGLSCPVCKFVLLSQHRERERERKRERQRVGQTWTRVNGHLRYPP